MEIAEQNEDNVYCQINIKLREDGMRKMTDSEIEEQGRKLSEFLKRVRDRTIARNEIDIEKVDKLLYQQMERLAKESAKKPDSIITISAEMVEMAKIIKTPVQMQGITK